MTKRSTRPPLAPGALPARAAAAPLALLFCLAFAAEAAAQTTIGPETRLPLPRFVSLKTDKVNLREGPSKDHATRFVYARSGLPVEVIAEFDNWRRVRDADGTDGWVWHSLLSGRRTAIVAPWYRGGEPLELRESERGDARIVARIEPGVVVGVRGCGGETCRVVVEGPGRNQINGVLPQDVLFGVYPGERFE